MYITPGEINRQARSGMPFLLNNRIRLAFPIYSFLRLAYLVCMSFQLVHCVTYIYTVPYFGGGCDGIFMTLNFYEMQNDLLAIYVIMCLSPSFPFFDIAFL